MDSSHYEQMNEGQTQNDDCKVLYIRYRRSVKHLLHYSKEEGHPYVLLFYYAFIFFFIVYFYFHDTVFHRPNTLVSI